MTRSINSLARSLRGLVPALALAMLLCLTAGEASAQRRVTPVKSGSKNLTGVNENKHEADTLDRSKLVEVVDEHGHKVLVDTVTGKEVTDTIGPETLGRVPKMIYPLLYSVSVGVDLWDPLMRIFGQEYGIAGVSAEINLHNRYIPVVEFGFGAANSTPAQQNYTYHSPLSPWFRIGANYNFLYNSNPDYQFVAGLRLGYSHFNYDLRDVTITDGYWGEDSRVDFPRQTASATYLNVLFGLRVKIWRPISMGWNIRFRTILHESKQPGGKPWYIPGYGARNGIITGSFSVFYTFSLDRKKKAPELPPGFTEIPSDEPLPPPLPTPDGETPDDTSDSPEPELLPDGSVLTSGSSEPVAGPATVPLVPAVTADPGIPADPIAPAEE